MCKLPTKHAANAAASSAGLAEAEPNLSAAKSIDFRSSSSSSDELSHPPCSSSSDETSTSDNGEHVEQKSDEEKHDIEEKDEDFVGEGKEDDLGKDDEDLDLEHLVAQDWKGKQPAAPLLRRQKRRQRQRANAKVGRALRRFVVSKGHRLSTYHQLLLDQAQRDVVAYIDFIFGPMNLPNDRYLNNVVLDRTYKSATVSSIMGFDGIHRALAPLGTLDAELQLAVVVDSLRWSQAVRCGPVCYPDGNIVFCFRVKSCQQQLARTIFQPEMLQPVVFAPAFFQLCVCGNCNGMIDARYGYCASCGVVFE